MQRVAGLDFLSMGQCDVLLTIGWEPSGLRIVVDLCGGAVCSLRLSDSHLCGSFITAELWRLSESKPDPIGSGGSVCKRHDVSPQGHQVERFKCKQYCSVGMPLLRQRKC